MIQQAVILAAGRGTRLGPLTKDRPKSMLPVLGKPIMTRVMDRMREAGIKRFVVVIGPQDGEIASYLTDSWYPDTEIKFAVQVEATGTVDALQLAAPHVDSAFVLSSVDNLTSAEHVQNLVARFNTDENQIATLSLLPATPEKIRKSADVIIEGDYITGIREKPANPQGKYASIMLYAFAKDMLDYLAKVQTYVRGERDVSSAIQLAIKDGKRVSYVTTDWRLHLTNELDLLAINRQFLQEDRDTHILSEIPGSIQIMPPVRIDPRVSVGPRAKIGPNVYLESGATVGPGAILADTIVLDGGIVPAGASCHGEVVDPSGRISENTK
ncbi:MAG: NTP transferase domain-containing protein [Anaerolineae bacterium]|nr:NTP transferase domain-containing protein [Anaerolineae bacterium]